MRTSLHRKLQAGLLRQEQTAKYKPVTDNRYVPGAHPRAEQIMRSVARELGFRLKFNSRGDWLCYCGGRFCGVIVNITSEFSAPAPSPIASRYVTRSAGEPLRSAMNDALIHAGILGAAS